MTLLAGLHSLYWQKVCTRHWLQKLQKPFSTHYPGRNLLLILLLHSRMAALLAGVQRPHDSLFQDRVHRQKAAAHHLPRPTAAWQLTGDKHIPVG